MSLSACLVMGMISGCNASPRETIVSVSATSAGQQKPPPAALDAAVAKHVTADELYTIYSQDLIIGANPDQRFANQVLIVTGVVNGFNRRLKPAVYLELRTHDKDAFTYAEFHPGISNPLETLQPGTTVRLLCRGNGMTIGSPLLRACRSL